MSILLALAPAIAWGAGAADRLIEETAAASPAFRNGLGERVHVRAVDGIVTLTGIVADGHERALAAATVRPLPGVSRVDNRLEISVPDANRADGWIALRVRGLLLLRAGTRDATLHVAVTDGVVSLTGTVADLAQKELADTYARNVEGVKRVRNDIRVSDLRANDRTDPVVVAPREPVDDGTITAQVKHALLTEPGAGPYASVDTQNGVVTLRGDARSLAERQRTAELAGGVHGVSAVINELRVSVAE